MDPNYRLCLINPPITPEEKYGIKEFGSSGGRQMPLGIFYIASFLIEKGIDVKIIDADAECLDDGEIINRIRTYNADVVGITSTTMGFHRAHDVARKIKEYDEDLPILLGGSHVTALPEYSMSFACFDYGIIGEGEITTYQLLQAIKDHSDPKDVDGIIYKKEGEIIRTRPRKYIENLDILPFPARHLVPIKLYKLPAMDYRRDPALTLLTSRGCPNQCIFCDRNVFGQRYREHSAEYVVAEIDELVEKYGAKEVAFMDDTFTINKRRVERIMELMKERGHELDWSCMARVNTVDKEFLQKMKASGCWHIAYGIESGDQDVLDFIKKNITLEQIRRTVQYTEDAGIESKGFFIIGHLVDTKESIEKTIQFAKSLPLSEAFVTLNTPIPNTEQYKIAERYGNLSTSDWSKFSYYRPVFVPARLDEEYLLRMRKKFYREFYIHPKRVINHLKKIRSGVDVKRYANALNSFSYFVRRGR